MDIWCVCEGGVSRALNMLIVGNQHHLNESSCLFFPAMENICAYDHQWAAMYLLTIYCKKYSKCLVSKGLASYICRLRGFQLVILSPSDMSRATSQLSSNEAEKLPTFTKAKLSVVVEENWNRGQYIENSLKKFSYDIQLPRNYSTIQNPSLCWLSTLCAVSSNQSQLNLMHKYIFFNPHTY